MGRTTESSPRSYGSTAEPTGGCTVPVGSLVVLLRRRLVGLRRRRWTVGGGPVARRRGRTRLGRARPAGLFVLLRLFKTCRVSTTLVFSTAGRCERPRRSLYDAWPRPCSERRRAPCPPDGGPGAVTPYPPRLVHRPDWLPGRAPTGQVIAGVIPSGSRQPEQARESSQAPSPERHDVTDLDRPHRSGACASVEAGRHRCRWRQDCPTAPCCVRAGRGPRRTRTVPASHRCRGGGCRAVP